MTIVVIEKTNLTIRELQIIEQKSKINKIKRKESSRDITEDEFGFSFETVNIKEVHL